MPTPGVCMESSCSWRFQILGACNTQECLLAHLSLWYGLALFGRDALLPARPTAPNLTVLAWLLTTIAVRAARSVAIALEFTACRVRSEDRQSTSAQTSTKTGNPNAANVNTGAVARPEHFGRTRHE